MAGRMLLYSYHIFPDSRFPVTCFYSMKRKLEEKNLFAAHTSGWNRFGNGYNAQPSPASLSRSDHFGENKLEIPIM